MRCYISYSNRIISRSYALRKSSEIIRGFAHRLPNGCPILEPLQLASQERRQDSLLYTNGSSDDATTVHTSLQEDCHQQTEAITMNSVFDLRV